MKSLHSYMVNYASVQRQFAYFIVAIRCKTLKTFIIQFLLGKEIRNFCTVTSTKEAHQIPKNQISLAGSLSEI